MRIELQQLDRIDAYLNGSMNAETQTAFEQEMKQSPELRELVENQQLIIRSVQQQALLAEINRFSKPNTAWTITKWLSAGIVVAGLVSAGIWWKLAEKKEAPSNKTAQSSMKQSAVETTVAPEDSISGLAIETPRLPGQPLATASRGLSGAGKAAEKQNKISLSPAAATSDPYDVGGLKTWIAPQRQYFSIDPEKGKTIECKDGTLVIVPTDAFLDEQGNIIASEVQLEIVEALSVADMLAYNLTTMNDGRHLQSGGMIYVQPRVKGKNVSINPERPLYIEIPTEKEVPAMLAWKGETSGGNINWTAPRKLEKFLTPVKFDLLDFLPNGFAQEVEASLPFRKHKVISKFLTDSLYYSLATVEGEKWDFKSGNNFAEEEIVRIKKNTYALGGIVIEDGTKEPVANANVRIYSFAVKKVSDKFSREMKDSLFIRLIDSVFTNAEGNFMTRNMKEQNIFFTVECADYQNYKSPELILPLDRLLTFQPSVTLRRIKPKDMAAGAFKQINSSIYKGNISSCMIDPLSIKAIKTKEFSKTFLATREFEERIRVLHQMPDAQSLLELYINNLSGNLWEADSLAALKLSGADRKRFEAFAAEKHTNVKNKNIYQEQLSAYYNQKRTEYEKTILKMRGEYKSKKQQELANMSQEINALEQSYSGESPTSVPVSPLREAEIKALQPNPAVSSSYGVNWYGSGWMNIDCYTSLLASGSKEVKISLNLTGSRVYQSINTLKTIIQLNSNEGKARAMFPRNGAEGSREMKSAFCIGIMKERDTISYAESHYDPYSNEEIQLEWEKMTEKEFYARLKNLPYGDAKFGAFLKQQDEEIIRRQAIVVKQEVLAADMKKLRDRLSQENAFIERLENIAGSCGMEIREAKTKTLIYEQTKIPAEFPGGELSMKKFIRENLQYPKKVVSGKVEGTSWLRFVIQKDGSITNVEVRRKAQECPECDQEAIRMIQSMPAWTPAKINDLAVPSYFDIPIRFLLK